MLALGYRSWAALANGATTISRKGAPRSPAMTHKGENPMISDFRDKRVTVMGLGSFGGGIGAVQFLAGQGAMVTVTDLKPASELARSLESISGLQNVTLHLGGHEDRDFRDADLVVASPAIPRDDRYLAVARQSGIAVT